MEACSSNLWMIAGDNSTKSCPGDSAAACSTTDLNSRMLNGQEWVINLVIAWALNRRPLAKQCASKGRSSILSLKEGRGRTIPASLAYRSPRKRPLLTPANRSRFVAETILTSKGIGRVAPTGTTARSSKTRSNLTWVSGAKSPISSRNKVPPLAAIKTPALASLASVKAPFRCPNNMDSAKVAGTADTLKATNGFEGRPNSAMALATTSLPVPDSPKIKILVWWPAILAKDERTFLIASPWPSSPGIAWSVGGGF
ncbi:MAG: hypothetical protein BWX66_01793 [Deltaproteobacteria bacterium ADurb.Bin058]|nr:MAG: hypothetical protein BWX66_01793 [Deltaproteobacteria bacterium ADurb.Bin058]